MRKEIAGISGDWHAKRQWFVRGNTTRSNQWTLPTEGLIRACLAVGKESCPAEYELGVRNLLAALDAQGRKGEFCEGIGYASMTVEAHLSAAYAMAVAGDMRPLNSPFMRNFPTWLVHHLQPGRFQLNTFDGGGNKSPFDSERMRHMLSAFIVLTGDPVARWALGKIYDGPSSDLAGLLARATSGPSKEPALFATYDVARHVNWRDSWDDAGSGVWVRGGHRIDSHDHYDHGHVNFIVGGKPLLIEAGCPSYDNPKIHVLYTTLTGHNVLEIEGVKAKRTPAPITVNRLDASGGDIVVDPTTGYPGLQRWLRQVNWTARRLDVTDEVAFPTAKPGAPLFRWHLGTQEKPAITGEGKTFQVAWADGKLTLESSVPIAVSHEMLPDNTVNLGEKAGGWDYQHTCLVVRPVEKTAAWQLHTVVKPL